MCNTHLTHAVSCPYVVKWRRVLRFGCDALALGLLSQILLVLSGNVELNPGPTRMNEILEALQSVEEKQAAMNTELNELRTTLLAHENLISSLTNRMAALELSQQSWNTQTKLDEAGEIKHEISVLKTANTDVNNRMRRNNLLFLGLYDSDNETWVESETKILSFCSNQLDIKLDPTGIERAHRLGKFNADKNGLSMLNWHTSKPRKVS